MSSSLRFQDLPTLQKIAQQWAKTPSFWATLTSLGLHGVFFLILPLLPYNALKTNAPEIRRSVGLVELTPAEQARLPDFSTAPEIQLPEIVQAPAPPANSDLFSNFPPIPDSSSVTPIPDSSSSLPIPVIPTFPIFPIAPPTTPQITTQIPVPSTTPSLTPSPSPSASPSPTPTQSLPQLTPANPQLSGQPQPTPSPDVAANTQPTPTPSSTPQATPNPLIARQQELRRLYTYSPEGTTSDDALQAYTDWLQGAIEWLGSDWDQRARAQQIELVGDYPKTACVRKLSGAAIVGVLVDADGKVVEQPAPPTLLQSSGYPIFNERALQAAAAYAFEATGKKQAYQVLVNFDGNAACAPSANPESAPAG